MRRQTIILAGITVVAVIGLRRALRTRKVYTGTQSQQAPTAPVMAVKSEAKTAYVHGVVLPTNWACDEHSDPNDRSDFEIGMLVHRYRQSAMERRDKEKEEKVAEYSRQCKERGEPMEPLYVYRVIYRALDLAYARRTRHLKHFEQALKANPHIPLYGMSEERDELLLQMFKQYGVSELDVQMLQITDELDTSEYHKSIRERNDRMRRNSAAGTILDKDGNVQGLGGRNSFLFDADDKDDGLIPDEDPDDDDLEISS